MHGGAAHRHDAEREVVVYHDDDGHGEEQCPQYAGCDTEICAESVARPVADAGCAAEGAKEVLEEVCGRFERLSCSWRIWLCHRHFWDSRGDFQGSFA